MAEPAAKTRTTDRASVLAHAFTGVLATVTGMAVGHLVASLLNPAASPVVAVGSTVIDLTPTPVKTWAIDTFGTADKPILIGSVIAVTLLLSGVAGVLARRRLVVGSVLLLLLVGTAGVLALTRPTAEALDLLPALATALVGVGLFVGLVLRIPSHVDAAHGAPAEKAALPHPMGATADSGPETLEPGGGEPTSGASRRGFLLASGAAAALALVAAGAGQLIRDARTSIGNIVLPAAQDVPPPLPEGLESMIDDISPFRTPTEDFYRVDTNLTVPIVDVDDWTLTIDGDVDQEVTLTFQDLLDMRLVERDITMTCVSNTVGGPYIGSARWLGVPIKDVLDLAGISSTGADQILSTAVDGFTISTPLDVALDGRDCMVVVGMNGEPLPREHGFPVRIITPGIYGYVGGTKWVERLTLTTFAEQEAYWTERDWAAEGPIKVSTRIDTPKAFNPVPAGEIVVAGVAWAQTRGIAKVEVSIDGGPWEEAEMGPDAGTQYWRQWFYRWQADEGRHQVMARATTLDGELQTAVRADPFPDGASGIQNLQVVVEA